jgi:hypothetical protein
MGGNASSYSPSALPSASARQTFERFLDALQLLHHTNREAHPGVIALRDQLFESLRQNPPDSPEAEIRITGPNNGPLFLDILPSFVVPQALTSISLRKSGLRNSHLTPLTQFLTHNSFLKELDLSENELGHGAHPILLGLLGHPSIISLQMEDCGIETAAIPLVNTIVRTTRLLRVLRVGAIAGPPDVFAALVAGVPQNRTLVDLSVSTSVDPLARPALVRNLAVSEITAEILQGHVPQSYLTKTRAIKAIKLRQRESSSDVSAGVRRASRSQPEARVRFGMAETIGRRSEMNGISIAVHDSPVPRATLFGVFDGHGGREAVEYASANLPAEIAAQLAAGHGYAEAFEAVHGRMAGTCTFSGTTAALAVVHQNRITVAAVGDTRCVLGRAGQAVQLTVDHRPDLEDEAAHILSKGGRIEDGRVNGVLEISRTLGDAVLGECVRATPDVQTLSIRADDQFFILACDGVWSVMSNQ